MVRRPYFILLLLALMFIMPGLTAYLLYLHPTWLEGRTNRGNLLRPPVLLPKAIGKEKWRIVFWQPGDCHEACLKQLDKIARVRLALGRHLYKVDLWLISDSIETLSGASTRWLHEQAIQIMKWPWNKFPFDETQKGRVFIISPESYIILSYPKEAKPDDIFHDIKHLVTVTEKS